MTTPKIRHKSPKEDVRHACRAGGHACGRFRDEANWSGNRTTHCAECGELFGGEDGFDRHYKEDGTCGDPATLTDRKGALVFKWKSKPRWNPAGYWAQRARNEEELSRVREEAAEAERAARTQGA